MLGFDAWIANLSDGASVWIVVLVAVLLGLRHATDPDHLAAVTTLVAGTPERVSRAAAALGLAWGVGHATTLFAFGLPILLLEAYVPERAQQAAETAVAVVIAYLAVRLIFRWRRGLLHAHLHAHAEAKHSHVHGHTGSRAHEHRHRARTPLGAFAIGLVHGMGGSAGVGVLLVAAVQTTWLAVVSLILLAVFTAVSMTLVSTGFGRALISRPVRAACNGVAPSLALASLAFGIWYGTAAWGIAPYPF
jgi:ABC-type nickel/cobalt efflux system permease component RcnA